MSTDLVKQIADQLGISETDAGKALESLASSLSGLAKSGGSLEVPGLGRFDGSEGELTFAPTQEVADAVNHRFSELDTLVVEGDGESVTVIAPQVLDDSADSPQDQTDVPIEDAVALEEVTAGSEDEARDDDLEDESPSMFVDTEDEFEGDRASVEDELVFLDDTDADETVQDDVAVEVSASSKPASEVSETSVDQAEPESVSIDPQASRDRKPMPSDRRGNPVVRLFLPLAVLLAVIFGTLWMLNRGPGTADDVAETQSPAQTSGPENSPVDPVPSEDQPAEATSTPLETMVTPPAWEAGGISRARGGYTIIVSSEPSRSAAEAIASAMASRISETVDVLATTVNGQTRFRVGVGQYQSAGQATRQLRSLSDQLPEDSWVTQITRDM